MQKKVSGDLSLQLVETPGRAEPQAAEKPPGLLVFFSQASPVGPDVRLRDHRKNTGSEPESRDAPETVDTEEQPA